MYKLKSKMALSILLTFVMVLSTSFVASANDLQITENVNGLSVDINSLDLSKPYLSRVECVDSNGDIVIIEHTFTPNPNYVPDIEYNPMKRDYSSYATAGTWNASASWLAHMFQMSYTFDLTKDYTTGEWTISNGRNLAVAGIFCAFSNQRLLINRPTSTPMFAAEIAGSVDIVFFDNQWVNIGGVTAICLTTVHGTLVTTTYN